MATDVYSFGLVYASVCSDEPIDEMLAEANRHHPTGISSQWELSDEETFANGAPNPGPCEQNPERKHYLLVC